MYELVARGLYIDGAWAPPRDGSYEKVVNPATEEPVGTAPAGSAADAHRAIDAARRAFDDGPWPRLTLAERTTALRRFQAALAELSDRVIDISVWEAGIVRSAAMNSVIPIAAGHLEFAISECSRDLIESLPLTTVPLPGGTSLLGGGVVTRDPVGVVAAIVPFNSPYQVSVGKVGPALATGNTVVLKPSPFTPFGSLIVAEAAEMADLPPGVVNVVTGGADVGEALAGSRDVDMVSFTGSDRVGALVAAQAAPTLKKVVLELGGKSAQIVLADADIAKAAASGTANYTSYAGQGCSLRTRHLVHRSVLAQYVDALAAAAQAVVVGDPDAAGTTMGPLINAAQRDRVEGYVARGLSDGATLVCGGGRPARPSRGYFVEPTVLSEVSNADVIAREEIFGPVSVVIPFDSDEEAVRIANDCDFGLGGSIWSQDLGRAFALARRIRTGQIHLNGGPGTQTPVAPFGGMKRSGVGREYGREGLLEYTETKYIGFKAG
jgi:aldehyde dehydrogenase (NAD+)